MIGTAEERQAKRFRDAARSAETNALRRAYGNVQPGTTKLLNDMRTRSGLSMDKLLYKLVRMGERAGI
jgi:hypothetical protein